MNAHVRMGRVVMVTGTDTGVGKTYVTAGLGRALSERGVSVVAVKPVESGVGTDGPEDGEILAEATGQTEPASALLRLAQPLAPPVAADIEGRSLDAEEWADFILAMALDHDLVLVEGAGGLLAPLTWDTTLIHLAERCRGSFLVVTSDRIGCISHTRLTVEALRRAGLAIEGLVLCAPSEPDPSTGTNEDTLARLLPGIPITTLPRLDHWRFAVPLLANLADNLAP